MKVISVFVFIFLQILEAADVHLYISPQGSDHNNG